MGSILYDRAPKAENTDHSKHSYQTTNWVKASLDPVQDFLSHASSFGNCLEAPGSCHDWI